MLNISKKLNKIQFFRYIPTINTRAKLFYGNAIINCLEFKIYLEKYLET